MIHTVVFDHDYGTDVYVCDSMELAEFVVWNWASHYWYEIEDEVGPIPNDREEAVRMYFECQSQEGATISQANVIHSEEDMRLC